MLGHHAVVGWDDAAPNGGFRNGSLADGPDFSYKQGGGGRGGIMQGIQPHTSSHHRNVSLIISVLGTSFSCLDIQICPCSMILIYHESGLQSQTHFEGVYSCIYPALHYINVVSIQGAKNQWHVSLGMKHA